MYIPCNEKQLIKRVTDIIMGKVYRDNNKDKAREYGKKYREENKEIIKKRKQEYDKAHPEARSKYRKEYYETNKTKIAEKQKEYRETNKDKISDYFKQYNIVHKEEKRVYKKEYREKNKDKISAKQKQCYETNKAVRLQKCAAYYAQRKADGYSYRLDPETGKHTWVKTDTAPLRKAKLSIPNSEHKLIKYVQKTFTAKGIA